MTWPPNRTISTNGTPERAPADRQQMRHDARLFCAKHRRPRLGRTRRVAGLLTNDGSAGRLLDLHELPTCMDTRTSAGAATAGAAGATSTWRCSQTTTSASRCQSSLAEPRLSGRCAVRTRHLILAAAVRSSPANIPSPSAFAFCEPTAYRGHRGTTVFYNINTLNNLNNVTNIICFFLIITNNNCYYLLLFVIICGF